MISQGCAHAHTRACVGDIIEPAALRRNGAYVNFQQYNSFAYNKLPYNFGPKVYRLEEYNCQMYELMFQAGVKGMSSLRSLVIYKFNIVYGNINYC